MASVNKVILIGNLGRDPETRYTTGGDAVTNLNIATSEQWKDKSGEKQERTEWHRVVLFGRQAEVAGEYLKKGRSVYIEGRLQLLGGREGGGSGGGDVEFATAGGGSRREGATAGAAKGGGAKKNTEDFD